MTLQRKIYLSILTISAFSFMACGKKVTNSNPNEGQLVNRTPALTGNSLKLSSVFDNNGVIENEVYQFEADAWIKIPEFIFVESGEPLNYTARVYFNTENQQTLVGARELYCEYQSAKQIGSKNKLQFDGYYHHFIGCFEDLDQDGTPQEINYNPGSEVPQDKDKFVRIEFLSGFSDNETQISADLEIDWF